MIIDFHAHAFPNPIAASTIAAIMERGLEMSAKTDGTVQGLKKSMVEAGIDLSIVLPVVTRPEQFSTINDFARKISKIDDEAGIEIRSFGGIHPDSDHLERELKELAYMGFQGIKLHPDYQNTFIDDEKMIRLIDMAEEMGFITVVHGGTDLAHTHLVRCTPQRVLNLLKHIKPEKLVIAHFAGLCEEGEDTSLLLEEKVYLDTSYMLQIIKKEKIAAIINQYGSKRIIFGSDTPWSSQEKDLNFLRNLGLSDIQLEDILQNNARKLLGI